MKCHAEAQRSQRKRITVVARSPDRATTANHDSPIDLLPKVGRSGDRPTTYWETGPQRIGRPAYNVKRRSEEELPPLRSLRLCVTFICIPRNDKLKLQLSDPSDALNPV